ncbi:MAG: cell wall hydrolase [Lachnospiraceae bacterium]|nr:cell wall hydrolase [Lachnospiraceae bacterium]MBQ6993679.1 cell wall hydrolase [Lachnospiraceae bacterium]
MYQKKCILLLLINVLCTGLLWVARTSEVKGQEALKMEQKEMTSVVTIEDKPIVSVPREIRLQEMVPQYVIKVSEQDIECLMRIVEAEAGCEDRIGKLLVANVVINRVRDEAFPNTVTEVVYQRNSHSTQFSPVSNGRIDTVKISEETKEVVYSALLGEDVSQGALYFVARRYADPDKVCWFDNNLTHLFSHGGHDFFF